MIKANCSEPASWGGVGGWQRGGGWGSIQIRLLCEVSPGSFLAGALACVSDPSRYCPKGSPFLPSPNWELKRSTSKCWESGQLRPKDLSCGPQCSPSCDPSGPLFFLCEMGLLIPTFLKHKDEWSDMQSAWHGVGLHQCCSQFIIFRACKGEGSRPQPTDHPAVRSETPQPFASPQPRSGM